MTFFDPDWKGEPRMPAPSPRRLLGADRGGERHDQALHMILVHHTVAVEWRKAFAPPQVLPNQSDIFTETATRIKVLFTGPSCPDCGARPGHSHHDGCDIARCVNCGQQLISNPDCRPGDVWMGEWCWDSAIRLGLAVDPNDVMKKYAQQKLIWLWPYFSGRGD